MAVNKNCMLFQHTDWSRMELRLAENIARFRKSRGYTQEELAKRLSISSQAVSKWENAQSLPDISLLPALAGLGDGYRHTDGIYPEKESGNAL